MNKFAIRFLIRFSQGDPLFHTCLSSMLCHILGNVKKEENSLVFSQVHVFCPGCPTVPLFAKKLIFVCLSSVKRNSRGKIGDWCLATCVCVSENWSRKVEVVERSENSAEGPRLFTWKLKTDTASLSPLLVSIQLESPPVPRRRLAPSGRG